MKCDSCGAPVENGKCTYCGKEFPVQQGAEKTEKSADSAYVYGNAEPGKDPGKPNKKEKFYQSTWFCIVMLLFLFPVGIFLMWKYQKFNKVARIVITVLLLLSALSRCGADDPEQKPTATAPSVSATEQTVTEVTQVQTEATEMSEQMQAQPETTAEQQKPEETKTADPGVSLESLSALAKAEQYGRLMHMSKAGIYDQLVSEYGEQFSEEAAQYAIDNVDIDWNANALAKAKDYSDAMHMSKAGIYDQLISEYGEQFTAEEAQYAVDNLQADWNENALRKAKLYQESMDMSPNAIYDQLVSEYGEQFTAEEAQYAVDHLG